MQPEGQGDYPSGAIADTGSVQDASEPAIVVTPADSHGTGESTGTRGRVYVLDDDESMRRSLSFSLETLGYEVEAYGDPPEFLNQARPRSPCVIVLDMRMPGLSGVDVQQKLQGRGVRCPVVFVSGDSLPAEVVTAMKQGAADFLLKPFSLDDLIAVIDRGIRQERRRVAQDNRLRTLAQRYRTLTTREQEICAHMLAGYGNQEIAEIDDCAPATVKLHRSRVLRKLHAETLHEMLALFEGVEPKALLDEKRFPESE